MRFFKRLWRAITALIRHESLVLAGHIAYTTIFAIFPFLIFLTALAGLLGSAEQANRLITMLFQSLPNEVVETLAPAIRNILTKKQNGLMTVGIVATLWSASSGIEALRLQLNRAYGGKNTRPFWMTRAQSLAFVVIGAFAVLLVSVLIIAGPVLIDLVAHFIELKTTTKLRALITQYGIAMIVLFGALFAMHRFLPNRRLKLRQLWPGVLLTGGLLIAAAAAFSIYLSKLGNFSVTYGSLGGVVLTLLFFYIAGVVFALGAEFNAAGADFTEARDSAPQTEAAEPS